MTDHTDTDTDATIPAVGDNSEVALKTLRAELKKLGASEGIGSASRPLAAKRLVDAAYDGLAKEGDAEQFYGDYQSGLIAAGKKSVFAVSAAAGEKVQISKFRQFIKVGMLPGVDARELMTRVEEHLASSKTAEIATVAPFDAMLNAARMQLNQPDTDLTDEQVAACVDKPERASKEEIEKLIDVFRKVAKLNETMPAPSGEATLQAMRDWIEEKGGVIPPMTKQEKELAAFQAQAARFGYAPQGQRDTSGAADIAAE